MTDVTYDAAQCAKPEEDRPQHCSGMTVQLGTVVESNDFCSARGKTAVFGPPAEGIPSVSCVQHHFEVQNDCLQGRRRSFSSQHAARICS